MTTINEHAMQLWGRARTLNTLLNTEWAEDHADEWEHFHDDVKAAYAAGDISSLQYGNLMLTAFYDFDRDELPEEVNDALKKAYWEV